MREHDLHVGEVDGDVVDVHRVRVFEADAAAARQACPDTGVPGVEQRRDPAFLDHLVQRVDLAGVREERLDVRVELEPADAVVADQPTGAVDGVWPVRVDRRERDQHVGMGCRRGGDLLVRRRRQARDGLGVDGEDDRGHVALAVVGGDVVDGRLRRVAEVPLRRLSPLGLQAVLTSPPRLGVRVHVNRDDLVEVDGHLCSSGRGLTGPSCHVACGRSRSDAAGCTAGS